MKEHPRVLVFGIGNPARGDDALGIRLLERIARHYPEVETLEVFQLQPEHALDVGGADLVLFCDAAVGLQRCCEFGEIQAEGARLAFTHALPPRALLEVVQRIGVRAPPPAFMLALRAESVELGEGLSAGGVESLKCGWALAARLCAEPSAQSWRDCVVAVSSI